MFSHSIWQSSWHLFRHSMFGSRRGALHPELAISGPLLPRVATRWQRRRRGGKKKKKKKKKEEGVAPLLKSRDTHLVGGEECLNMFRRCVYFDPASGSNWKQKQTNESTEEDGTILYLSY